MHFLFHVVNSISIWKHFLNDLNKSICVIACGKCKGKAMGKMLLVDTQLRFIPKFNLSCDMMTPKAEAGRILLGIKGELTIGKLNSCPTVLRRICFCDSES